MEESPSSAAAALPKGSVVRLIEELYAKRESITTLMYAAIDTEKNAEARWSTPPNPSAMAHLWRMMDVKLDRYYERGMYPAAQPAGPVAGVKSSERQLPRNVRRQIKKAQAKVHKAQRDGKGIPDLIKATKQS